jgi:hypothetical protein
LTEQHLMMLLNGRAFFQHLCPELFRNNALDLDAVRRLWDEFKRDILPRYITLKPGHRPWCWWQFDSPEPGRRLLQGLSPASDPAAPSWTKHLSFGVTHVRGGREFANPPIFESQACYLRHLHLLIPAEIAHLDDDAFLPGEEAADRWLTTEELESFADLLTTNP